MISLLEILDKDERLGHREMDDKELPGDFKFLMPAREEFRDHAQLRHD